MCGVECTGVHDKRAGGNKGFVIAAGVRSTADTRCLGWAGIDGDGLCQGGSRIQLGLSFQGG